MLPFLLKHCSAHETPTARSAVIIVGRTVKQRSSIELAGELVQKSPCAIVILGFHKLMLFAVLNSLVLFVMCISDSEISPSRSEEHTSELQSLMRISYAVFCLKKKKKKTTKQ